MTMQVPTVPDPISPHQPEEKVLHDINDDDSSDDECDANISEKDKFLNAKIEQEILLHPNRLPRATWFIIPNEFCERFSYYGINPLLLIYFKNFIGVAEAEAKMLTHQFTSFVYYFPLVGGAISDSFLGKYHTIVYLSFVYILGGVLLVLVSYPGVLGVPNTSHPIPLWAPLISLLLIALGAGGIKACVSAHGGDQYLKHQKEAITLFFTLFYTAINAGALISGYLTPALKEINCFNTLPNGDGTYAGDCYSLAFAVPAFLLICALTLFIIGKKYYRVKPPIGEFLPLKIVKITAVATKGWFQDRGETKKGFLDYAEHTFGHKWVHEARAFWSMVGAISPSILIYAVYNQSFTEFQYQYEKMNPKVFGLITIVPEQSSNINTVMVILLASLFAKFIYPWCGKFTTVTPLKKILVGYLFVCVSFFFAGVMNFYVESMAHPITNEKGDIVGCKDCVNGAWQWILFLLMSIGEVVWNVTQLEYAYTAVGKRMKSSASAMNLVMNALGNQLVVLVEMVITRHNKDGTETQLVSSTNKYFMWTGIGLIGVVIHLFIMRGHHRGN